MLLEERKVKIALIQFGGILADTKANTAHAVELCIDAAQKGAQILCLPELFSTGYNLGLIGSKIPKMAQKLAEIRGMDVEEIIRITTENAKRLYRIED